MSDPPLVPSEQAENPPTSPTNDNMYIDHNPLATRASVSKWSSKRSSSRATLEPSHSTPLIIPNPEKQQLSLTVAIPFCMGAWFILNINYALSSSFFPSEATSKGATTTDVGIIFACFSFTECLATPIASYVVQRFGPRRVFLAGLTVETLACVAFGFVRMVKPRLGFIIAASVIRLVQGLGAALSQTAAFVLILYMVPPEDEEKRGLSLGAMETAGGLGLMLGPTLGGLLYGVGGFQTPFAVIGGIMCSMGMVALCIFPSDARDVDENVEKPGFMVLMKSKVIWFAIVCILFNMAAWSFMEPTLELFLKSKYHVSSIVVGAAFSVCVALYAVCAPLAGFIGGKATVGYYPLMCLGVVIEAVGFLLVGPSPLPKKIMGFSLPDTLWIQFVGLGVIGLGAAFAMVPIMPWISQHAGYIARNTDELVAGLTAGAFAFGGIIGPIASSALVDRFRFEWASTLFSGVLWVLLILMTVAWSLKVVQFPKNAKNYNDGDGGGGDGSSSIVVEEGIDSVLLPRSRSSTSGYFAGRISRRSFSTITKASHRSGSSPAPYISHLVTGHAGGGGGGGGGLRSPGGLLSPGMHSNRDGGIRSPHSIGVGVGGGGGGGLKSPAGMKSPNNGGGGGGGGMRSPNGGHHGGGGGGGGGMGSPLLNRELTSPTNHPA